MSIGHKLTGQTERRPVEKINATHTCMICIKTITLQSNLKSMVGLTTTTESKSPCTLKHEIPRNLGV